MKKAHKMEKKLIIITVFVLFISSCSGCIFSQNQPGPEVKEFIEKKYDVDSIVDVSVSTINGNIRIKSWDNSSILLNATKRSRYGYDDLDNAKLVVSETADEFLINIENTHPVRNRAVDLIINIPLTMPVSSVASTNGNVHLINTTGDTSVTTTNGQIFTDRVNGFVSATSTNGGVKLIDSKGIGDIVTSNGRISVDILSLKENISIQSTNGDIFVNVDSSLNASVEAITTNGIIDVDQNIVSLSESSTKSLIGVIGFDFFKINLLSVNGDISLQEL